MANSIAPPFSVILEAMKALRFYVYMTHQICSSVISRVTQLIYRKQNFEKQYVFAVTVLTQRKLFSIKLFRSKNIERITAS